MRATCRIINTLCLKKPHKASLMCQMLIYQKETVTHNMITKYKERFSRKRLTHHALDCIILILRFQD